MLDERTVSCPYCGEPVTLVVDASAGAVNYIEDCPVCCRPMEVRVGAAEDGPPAVEARRDDE